MRRHTVQHHRHHTMNDRVDPNAYDPGEMHLQAQRLKREAERQSKAETGKKNMLKIGALVTLIALAIAWMGQDKLPEQNQIIALMPNENTPKPVIAEVQPSTTTQPKVTNTIPVSQTQTQSLPAIAAIAPPAPKPIETDKPSTGGLNAINEQAIQLASEGNPRQAINLLEKTLIDHKEAGPLFDNLRRLYAGFATQSYQMAMEPGKNKPINVDLTKGNSTITVQLAPQDMRARPVSNTPTATASLPELPGNLVLASTAAQTPPAITQPVETPSAPIQPVEPAVPAGPPPLSATERKEASNAVMNAVKTWSDAWAKQDVTTYLAAYAPTYKPKEMSRSEWEAYRKDRLTKPKFIRLELTDLKAFLVNNTRMKVTFTQHYSSETLKTKDKKTLELELINDQWRIISETGR